MTFCLTRKSQMAHFPPPRPEVAIEDLKEIYRRKNS